MKKIGLIILSLILAFASFGQSSFSLEEAIKYAVKNHSNMKNANLELENALQKINETRAIGLPQISGEAQFQNFIEIPTTVVPASSFNPMAAPGEVSELQFGTEFNTSASLSASQIIFNGSYLVGLKTSKVFKSVSEFNKVKTELDVKENVLKAYYGVLAAEKTVAALTDIDATSQKIYDDTKVMYEQGLIEEDNVTQLSLNVLTAKNSLRAANRQLQDAKIYLKLQMGMKLTDVISLTSKFDNVITTMDVNGSEVTSDVSQNINYLMMNQQLKLGALNVQYEKSKYLPTLSAFISHSQQAMGNEFNAFSGGTWYPTSVWGLNLAVPIFSSGMRRAVVNQASISLLQTENNLSELKKGLSVQTSLAKSNYDNAFDTYTTSKEAVKISKKIYNNYQYKFKEGLITSLDLSQIQTQYLSAETQYIQAIYNLINAKIELDKITNKL
ncbi:MAG: outer membrane protein [Flavobacteriales bacterium]|jgi:outer membrane protein TolC|tara:strand:+ start:631 stop:1959 length:1329 start_codon:yes stop_codon:yes gene_type:complete